MGLCTFARQRESFRRRVNWVSSVSSSPGARESRCAGSPPRAGVPLFYLGEIALARAHLEQEMALYDPQQQQSHAFHYGVDPRISCLSTVNWALWLLGYPDQALGRGHDALTLARNCPTLQLAYALQGAIRLHRFRREVQQPSNAQRHCSRSPASKACTVGSSGSNDAWLAAV